MFLLYIIYQKKSPSFTVHNPGFYPFCLCPFSRNPSSCCVHFIGYILSLTFGTADFFTFGTADFLALLESKFLALLNRSLPLHLHFFIQCHNAVNLLIFIGFFHSFAQVFHEVISLVYLTRVHKVVESLKCLGSLAPRALCV